ncbi:MAG TPA: hypothetical protein VL860_00665 [Planctomycetota bacterium]|nr:hypothetical protein [Planctomycetota bacterium]
MTSSLKKRPVKDRLLVARHDSMVVVRVEGLGHMALAPGLNEIFNQCFDSGCRQVLVDLAECTGVDSTFMGTMVGLAAELNSIAHEENIGFLSPAHGVAGGVLGDSVRAWVAVVNGSQANCDCLKTLGADRFITIAGAKDLTGLAMDPLETRDLSRRERIEVIRKAHEALVESDDRNRAKFGAFLDALKAEIGGSNS